eukprot:302647-Pyramimonas_sp.AAC.1
MEAALFLNRSVPETGTSTSASSGSISGGTSMSTWSTPSEPPPASSVWPGAAASVSLVRDPCRKAKLQKSRASNGSQP